LWGVFAGYGAALGSVSRLFAAFVGEVLSASDSVLKMNIENAMPYLSGIYSPIAESQGTPVARLAMARDLRRLFTSEKLLQDSFWSEGDMRISDDLMAIPAIAAAED
jgi:hypothetical protein